MRVDLANWALRISRNSPLGLKISSIRVFDQIRDPEIPIILGLLLLLLLLLYYYYIIIIIIITIIIIIFYYLLFIVIKGAEE